MLRGHLDALMSTGFFEGWAYDTERPAVAMEVAVSTTLGREVAAGLANLYRDDLVQAKCGMGWCAFRLIATDPVAELRNERFKLVERRSETIIAFPAAIKYVESGEESPVSIADLVRTDPTCLKSVDQLEGCGAVLEMFIKTRGVDAFVRTAYVYVLGRPADPDGLAAYGNLIRKSFISPQTMIRTLASSSEFQTASRNLVAPNAAGFPFMCN